MTGVAGCGRAVKHIIDMAGNTSHAVMGTGQREGRQVMVKGGWLPGGGGMACTAIRAVLSAMTVIGSVTAITGIGGGSLELQVCVAARTKQAGMRAGQLEGGVIVIETARLPGTGGVTGRTLRTQRIGMRIGVAG